MSKHTPGPWSVNERTGEINAPPGFGNVGVVYHARNYAVVEAALDLLAACETLYSELDELCDCNGAGGRLAEIADMCERAIAKAKGER